MRALHGVLLHGVLVPHDDTMLLGVLLLLNYVDVLLVPYSKLFDERDMFDRMSILGMFGGMRMPKMSYDKFHMSGMSYDNCSDNSRH